MKARQYHERGEYVVVEMHCHQPTAEELMDRRSMELRRVKSELQESDYKVIKCAEAICLNEELPYNMTALHNERQALRDKINELESEVGDVTE